MAGKLKKKPAEEERNFEEDLQEYFTQSQTIKSREKTGNGTNKQKPKYPKIEYQTLDPQSTSKTSSKSKDIYRLHKYLKEKEAKNNKLLKQINGLEENELDPFMKITKSALSCKSYESNRSKISRYSKNKLKSALQKPNYYIKDKDKVQRVVLEGEKVKLKPTIQISKNPASNANIQKNRFRHLQENIPNENIIDKLDHKILYDETQHLEFPGMQEILNNNENLLQTEKGVQKDALNRYLKSLQNKVDEENKRLEYANQFMNNENNYTSETNTRKKIDKEDMKNQIREQIMKKYIHRYIYYRKENKVLERDRMKNMPDIEGDQGYPPLKEENKEERYIRIRRIQNLQRDIWEKQVNIYIYIYIYKY